MLLLLACHTPPPQIAVTLTSPLPADATAELRGCDTSTPLDATGSATLEIPLDLRPCQLRVYAERWDADAFGPAADVTADTTALTLDPPPDTAWHPLHGDLTPDQDARLDALEATWIAAEDAWNALPGDCPDRERLAVMDVDATIAEQQQALRERNPWLLDSQEALAAQLAEAIEGAARACSK